MSTPKKLVLNFDDPNEYVLPEHASILNKHFIDEVRNMFTYTNTTTENRRDRLAEIVFKTKLPEWKCSAKLLAYHCYQYADTMIAAGGKKEKEEQKVGKINLNYRVRVKLTDYGRAIYTKNCVDPPKEDADGWSTFQLFDLMLMFGQHLYIGSTLPFDPEIEVIQ